MENVVNFDSWNFKRVLRISLRIALIYLFLAMLSLALWGTNGKIIVPSNPGTMASFIHFESLTLPWGEWTQNVIDFFMIILYGSIMGFMASLLRKANQSTDLFNFSMIFVLIGLVLLISILLNALQGFYFGITVSSMIIVAMGILFGIKNLFSKSEILLGGMFFPLSIALGVSIFSGVLLGLLTGICCLILFFLFVLIFKFFTSEKPWLLIWDHGLKQILLPILK